VHRLYKIHSYITGLEYQVKITTVIIDLHAELAARGQSQSQHKYETTTFGFEIRNPSVM
jgi:hypothetical protein